LDTGLDQPAGFTLPVKWNWSEQCWKSGPWDFRRGAMFLIPGNSPMGMRLPLASLPWVAPDKRESQEPQSLFEDLPELGDYYGEVTRRYSHIEAKILNIRKLSNRNRVMMASWKLRFLILRCVWKPERAGYISLCRH